MRDSFSKCEEWCFFIHLESKRTLTKLNKYTLEMVHISYLHFNQWSTDINKVNKKILVREESKLPKKCSILKSQL